MKLSTSICCLALYILAAKALATPGFSQDQLEGIQEAKMSFTRGDYSTAQRHYEWLLARLPGNPALLFNYGVIGFRQGKLKLSEVAFRKAVARWPKDASFHSMLGIVYCREAHYDDAINEFSTALALDPKNPAAQHYAGAIHNA